MALSPRKLNLRLPSKYLDMSGVFDALLRFLDQKFRDIEALITAGGGGGIDPANTFEFYTDFIEGQGNSEWVIAAVNGGSLTEITVDGHPGVWRLSVNNSSDFIPAILADVSTNGVGQILSSDTLNIEYLIRFSDVPTSAQNIECGFGIADQTSAANMVTAGAVHNGSASVWRLFARAATVTTTDDAATGPTADAWHHVKISMTSSALTMFVDGASVASLTTGLPTVDMSSGFFYLFKSAGTGVRTIDVDLMRVTRTFSTPRY